MNSGTGFSVWSEYASAEHAITSGRALGCPKVRSTSFPCPFPGGISLLHPSVGDEDAVERRTSDDLHLFSPGEIRSLLFAFFLWQ
ncbi:hypothetical protein TNCV_2677721 [Trichonephila clavipes]|nr:hypothetical protein TNCV_2677721 [Trichonephila clavipes]